MAAPKKKRPQDITSAEKSKRVNAVLELILSGSSKSQIVRYCSETYKVGQRAAENYLSDAKAIMIENYQKAVDVDSFKAEIYNRLEDLYQRNLEIDDFKACQAVLKDIREMMGLNSTQKIDVTTKGEQIQSIPIAISYNDKPINLSS